MLKQIDKLINNDNLKLKKKRERERNATFNWLNIYN